MTLAPLAPSSYRRIPDPGTAGAKDNLSAAVRSQVQFGRAERNYGTRDRVPDDVYFLLNEAPKNELHIHQGGSSSVDFLSYRIRTFIQNELDKRKKSYMPERLFAWSKWLSQDANAKILQQGLPVFQENGKPKIVRFTQPNGTFLPPDQLRAAMEQTLNRENLRNYYRFNLQAEHQRPYMDSEDLAETTATHQPRNEIISAQQSEELKKQSMESLKAYLHTSSKFNHEVKNPAAFFSLANEYAKRVARENVRYTEYRISPTGSGIGGANGCNIEEVLSNVDAGFKSAQQDLNQCLKKLDYGLIVLFERQNRSGQKDAPDAKVKRAIQLANDVVRLKREGKYNICGVDLAGDEARNPVTEFKPAFDIINEYNRTAPPEQRLGITIHAGETPKSGPYEGYQSIEKAIEVAENKDKSGQPLTQVRIGHGLQIINSSQNGLLKKAFEIYCQHPNDWEERLKSEGLSVAKLRKDSPLLDKVIADKIVLEMCPKSNLQTYGIHPGFPNEQFSVRREDYSAEAYKRHPAVFLSRLGVKIAISSDNRTISNTDVTNEFVKLFKYAGLTYHDFRKMVLNGFEGAFVADPKKKAEILKDVEAQFDRIERDPESKYAIELMDGTSKANLGRTSSFFSGTPWQRLKQATGQQFKALGDTIAQWWKGMCNWFARLFGGKKQ